MRTCASLFRIIALSLAIGCSEPTDPTEPTHTDVDLARASWLADRPMDYSYEFSVMTSWSQKSPFVRVTVSGGEVVAIRDAFGRTIQRSVPTIDEIWDRLLEAQADGELNSASFTGRGVPVEVNYGRWASDGGVAYWVRRFDD